MKIAAFGDIHGNLNLTQEMQQAIETADMLFLNGDITNFGFPSDLLAILETLKGHTSAPIRAVPGNCDTHEVFLELERAGINLHRSGEIIAKGLGIMAVGGSNTTPFKTPIEFEELDIAQFLNDGFVKVKDCESVILFSHCPPKDTNADEIASGAHVGSEAIRDFIKKHPTIKLVICGHIHEAIGTGELDGIPVVNHGMASDGHFVAIDATMYADGQWDISFETY